MAKEFKNLFDAVSYVSELVGTSNYPEVSEHMTQMVVEGAKVVDSNGYRVSDANYAITIDVNKAAADLFGIKAGYASIDYDFKSDNQSFSRSQVVDHLLSMQKYYQKNTYATFPANTTYQDVHNRFRLPEQYNIGEEC